MMFRDGMQSVVFRFLPSREVKKPEASLWHMVTTAVQMLVNGLEPNTLSPPLHSGHWGRNIAWEVE